MPRGGYDLAVALHATGDFRGAAAVIAAAIRLADTDDVEAWLRLGTDGARRRGQPDVAEPFFRHAVEMRPDLAAARQQYGLNLLVLGRFEEAARELARSGPARSARLRFAVAPRLLRAQAGTRRRRARARGAALRLNPGAIALAGGILRGGGS